MAKRKVAARKMAARKTETRRGYASAPLGVLLVTPAALSNILAHGVVNVGAAVPQAPRTATARETATPRTATKVTPKATATAKTGGAGRGRVAEVYVPKAKALAPDANPKMAKVFNFIKKNAKTGITQKSIVKQSRMPNSTVWYALVKLQKAKAVARRAA